MIKPISYTNRLVAYSPPKTSQPEPPQNPTYTGKELNAGTPRPSANTVFEGNETGPTLEQNRAEIKRREGG